MSGKPIIYFDLDNTLIDTNKLVRSIGHGLSTIGLPLEIYESTLSEYYDSLNGNWTDFNHQQLIELLAKNASQSLESIAAEFLNPRYFREAVYPEAIPTLESFSESHTLRIFSQANIDWQKLKIRHGEIAAYFELENSLISADKLHESIITQIAKSSTLVDDKWEVVSTLQQSRPDLRIFWINRKSFIPQDESIPQSIKQISSLDEMTA